MRYEYIKIYIMNGVTCEYAQKFNNNDVGWIMIKINDEGLFLLIQLELSSIFCTDLHTNIIRPKTYFGVNPSTLISQRRIVLGIITTTIHKSKNQIKFQKSVQNPWESTKT